MSASRWRRALSYAWSLRWIAIAAALSAAEIYFGFFADRPPFGLPRGGFAAVAGVTTVAAIYARWRAQKRLSR